MGLDLALVDDGTDWPRRWLETLMLLHGGGRSR